jgi:hypothetical protein
MPFRLEMRVFRQTISFASQFLSSPIHCPFGYLLFICNKAPHSAKAALYRSAARLYAIKNAKTNFSVTSMREHANFRAGLNSMSFPFQRIHQTEPGKSLDIENAKKLKTASFNASGACNSVIAFRHRTANPRAKLAILPDRTTAKRYLSKRVLRQLIAPATTQS